MLNTFKIGHKVVRMTPERLHHIFRLFQLLTLKRQMFAKMMVSSLREKCPYSELFSPNAGKYRREYLRIRRFLRTFYAVIVVYIVDFGHVFTY